MPQVSVIIPTRNRARFLARAVQSVLVQTYQDFEILVVDDASEDDSAVVVQDFDDQRIRLLRHAERRGGASARNTAIMNSSGEYLAFLDDDDEWLPEKLARQIALVLRDRGAAAVVYTGYVIVDESNGKICGQKIPRRRGNLYRALLENNCVGGTSSVLVRRSCFETVGLFDEALPSFQDYDLWIRIASSFQFDCITEPLLKYFVHPNKIWTDPEALMAGLKIMLDKYGQSPAFKKRCSAYYLSVGVRFFEIRQIEKARKALSQALACDPYKMKPYVYLCLTLFGLRALLLLRKTKAKASSHSSGWNL